MKFILSLLTLFVLSPLGYAGGGGGITTESRFLDQMTDHHRDAISMSRIALRKSTNAEIRGMAQKMIDDQTAEINQMQEWRAQFYPDTAEASDLPPMNKAHLEGSSGRQFNITFLDMMIKHHSDGIHMIGQMHHGLVHDEVQDFADMVKEKQTKEIAEMRAMKRAL